MAITGNRFLGRALFAIAAAAALGVAARGMAPAGTPDGVRAGDPGRIVDLPGDRGSGELLEFDERLVPALLSLAPEARLDVAGWPVAPGIRRTVHLARHEIYAPGARMLRVEGESTTEVPRSRLVFLWGTDDAGGGALVSVDPESHALQGHFYGPDGVYELAPAASDRSGRHLLARPLVPEGATWACGQEGSVETAVSREPPPKTRAESLSLRPNVLSSLHSGVVAIDTDNEYMAYWSNDTTNVTNYIATLLASINVMYERDLNLRLLQGTTFLRVSTTTDPYNVNDGGNADDAELQEFTNYWNANYPKATYPRSVVTLLSGKQPLPNYASGIAWIASSVCGGSFDYSFCQLFKVSYLYGDTLIVGHEIGHNLGSPHTHCYADPKPDTCYAGEAGTHCFSGIPGCPAPLMINGYNATGTIMSYCQLSPCSSGATLAYHPATISRYVGSTLDAGASSGCLAVVGGSTPTPTPTSTPTRTATSTPTFTPTRTPTPTFTSTRTPTPTPTRTPTSTSTPTVTPTTSIPTATPTSTPTRTATRTPTTTPTRTATVPTVSGTRLSTLTPCRVVDTRNPAGPLGGPAIGASSQRTFTLPPACGIPSGAKTVSANVTVVNPGAQGNLVIYPATLVTAPNTSTISFRAGLTRANDAQLLLSTDGTGRITVKNNSAAALDLVLDVNGCFQ